MSKNSQTFFKKRCLDFLHNILNHYIEQPILTLTKKSQNHICKMRLDSAFNN